jgi:protein TonB
MPTIDANAPPIATNQWGDPLATSSALSGGPGTKGIGNGRSGDGSGPTSGYGHDTGSKAFSLSQVTTPPVLILKIEPEYSEHARQAKFQGTVGLRIIVDEKGIPRTESR